MTRLALSALACVALAWAAPGCGGDPLPADGGTDAAIDSGADAGPPDAGPICAACDPGFACCGSPEEPVCARLADDTNHCGQCGIDCIGDGRGDRCESGQCACGDFLLGCVGTTFSHCCVPEDGVRAPYCANLAQDRTDCGACGVECPIAEANRCDGARCVCGDSRVGCEGTPTSTCCGDRSEVFSCVDTTTDRRHCGACGNRCELGLRCEAGACVP